jgi:hypothetical protein
MGYLAFISGWHERWSARRGGQGVNACARAVAAVRIEALEERRLLAASDLFINEFLASNTKGITDQDGDRSDWIEIYNPGVSAVNLAGWRLTDDLGVPGKWVFPAVPLAANSYLMVFASDKRRAVAGQELHTNFKLSTGNAAGGEYLALSKPDGTVVSVFAPTYPEQVADVSYGLGPPTTASGTLVRPGLPGKYLIPSGGSLGTSWTAADFVDAGWSDALMGVGFEKGNPALTSEVEPNNTTAAANVAAYNFQAYSGNLYQLPLRGSGLSTDYFKIGDLQSGDVLTVALAGSASRSGGYAADPKATLYRGDTISQTTLVTDDNGGVGQDALIGRYAVTANGNHYLGVARVSGNTKYDLGFWLENTGTAPLTGERFVDEVEPNSTFAQANDLSKSWRAVQYLSRTAGTISVASDIDIFSYQFKKDDVITIQIDSTSSLDAKVTLLNSAAATVAWEDGTSAMTAPYDKDSSIYALVIPSDGTYFVKVEAASGTGSYNADVYLSTDIAPPTSGSWGTYGGLIGTNIGPQMLGVNATAYVRVPFNAMPPSDVTSLTLRMKYDDGFAAYLNGTLVAIRNAPGALSYNSAATAPHQASAYEDIDITAYKGLLQEFGNVLAIQMLNASAADTDVLAVAELAYSSVLPGGMQYFSTPTPGVVNLVGAQGVVGDTKFSHDRGYYDAPFDLAITTVTAGAEIRYTLDGSAPTASTGTVYSGPIRIDKTRTVRAAAFKTGYIASDVDAQTYLFLSQVVQQTGAGFPARWDTTVSAAADYAMDPNVVSAYSSQIMAAMKALPTVSVVMDVNDLFGAQGIYPKFGAGEKPAAVEYFNDGVGQVQVNGGIVVGGEGIGGTSGDRWKTYKLSLRLKFKSIYGDANLDYPIYGSDGPKEFDTLILDAQINHTWLHPGADQQTTAKYINDQYIADLQSAMGGPGPKGRFVHLYLNGLYWGVYDLHERPDEHFAADYFGGVEEDYDVIKHGLSYGADAVVSGTATSFQDLFTRAAADLSQAANYQRVEQVLDIDDFIDYILINFYGGNHDWGNGGAKNWYATYNRVDPNGRWRFHSWDAEHSMENLGYNNTLDSASGQPVYLHSRLALNPEYRLKFADHIRKDLMDGGVLSPTGAAALYQKRIDEVYAGMIGESARWGDNRKTPAYTRDNWAVTQQGVLDSFISGRTNILLGQLKSQGLYTTIDAVTFAPYGGVFASAQDLDITHPNPLAVIYYTTDGADPRLTGGGINTASALRYTGSIYLMNSVRVKARVYDAGTASWSAMTEADFIIGPPPKLRITEMMYAPQPPTNSTYVADDFEFIELQNRSTQAMDLDGFSFTQGVTFTFPADTTLAANQRIVVVRNVAAFQSRYGTSIPIGGVFTGTLSDNGEGITLTTQLGQMIESFAYQGGWYDHADGEGFSLVAIDPMAAEAVLSTKEGWRPSNQLYGAPGAADLGYNPGIVVINEALTHTDQPLGDWIELYNTTDQRIDLSGWFLSDSVLNLAKYKIANNTFIEGHDYLVFTQTQHFGTVFGLSELGEKIHLTSVDAVGNPGGYREAQGFGASRKEVTFGRYVKSTGGSDFPAMIQPTMGQANALPRVGPVVISEVMYGPAVGGDEFIELGNLTNAPAPLFDPANPANTWQFTEGVTYKFPANITLAGGEGVLVVGIDPAVFRTKYSIPAGVRIFGPYTGMLDNAGENLVLAAPEAPEPDLFVPYYVVDRVNYDNTAPWPIEADGGNASLVRKKLGDYGNDVANWEIGPNGGSPGVVPHDATPPTLNIPAVVPNSGINTIALVFSEPVQNVDLSDLRLTRNGGPNLLTGSQTLSSVDKITWTLGGLGPVTFVEGYYMISVDLATSDIADMSGNQLVDGASRGFSVAQTTLFAPAAGPSYYLRLFSGNLEVFVNSAPPDALTPTYTVPMSSITTLVVDGTDGDDQLVLDFSNGSFIPPNGIVFSAGNHVGGDTMDLIGDGTIVAEYAPGSTGQGEDVIKVDGRAIRFTQTEAISVDKFQALTVKTPFSRDVLVVDSPTPDKSRVSGDSEGAPMTPLTISNITQLILDTATNDVGGSGDDSVTVLGNGAFPPPFFEGDGAPQLSFLPGAGVNLLRLQDGFWKLGSNLAFDGPSTSLVMEGTATLDLSANFTVASLALAGSALFTVAPLGGKLLTVGTLSIAEQAILDLADNDLLVSNGDLDTLETYVRIGSNDGAWDGVGLRTSAATALTTLGLIPKPNGILVKFTYYGDVNGDGVVNLNDYFKIDNGYLSKSRRFANGDVNYDGGVNLNDYFLIDSAYLGQSAPLGVSPAAATVPRKAVFSKARIQKARQRKDIKRRRQRR